MVEREYDYIKGNTAVKPSRKSTVSTHKKNKSKLQKSNKANVQKIETRKSTLMISVVILALGIITITGDAKVYNMQKQVTQFNNQISNAEETNEALNLKLLKFASLQNIKDSSEKNLSMVVPAKSDIVKIDFSENYFANLENNNIDENKAKGNLFSKIKDALRL